MDNHELKSVIKWNRQSDLRNHCLFVFFAVCSCFTFFMAIVDVAKPAGYELLFLLPVAFMLMVLMVSDLFDEIPYNLGLSIIFIAEFIRLVISPLFLIFSRYGYVISMNIPQNTPKAIMLMIYEAFAVGMALRLAIKRNMETSFYDVDSSVHNRRMNIVMCIVVLVTVLFCSYAPEILSNYRSILGLFTESNFVGVEQSYIVDAYSNTFFRKLFLVINNYILKVIRILLPLFLMVLFRRHMGKYGYVPSLIMVFSPLLLVDGAIARSLYYTVLLFVLFLDLYDISLKRMYGVILVGACFVTVYFVMRFTFSGEGFFEFMSYKFVDYFGGLNIVSGTFNLPDCNSTRFHYFIGDLLRTIPFANTLFGLDSGDLMQSFFNQCNNMTGCIPTTVGMGAYYFGVLLAPLYSFLFARLSLYYGRKYQCVNNPYYKFIYVYISFICAVGIGIYNHEIVLGSFVQIILPMYVMARIAYPRKKEGKV